MSTSALSQLQAALSHPMVRCVVSLVEQQCGQAYLVGGAVRDLLLTGQLPLDLDFTVLNCSAATVAKALADAQGGHLVPLDWDFGIHRVVFTEGDQAGLNVDLADALENNLDADLARRDLTLNAMALDLTTGKLIDPFNGQADLSAKTIRMVSEFNLLDDPLRMLRVFRVAATIQAATIDEATLAVVAAQGAKVWESASERVQYEFFRLLSVERCFSFLKQMADCGLLEVLIPDLTPMKAIGSSGFHHLGLFDHTLELVKQAERLIGECPQAVQDWVRQAFTPSVTRFGLIKLACLLHDIGKPATLGTREDAVHGQRLTFHGHEEVGEEMAEPLLKRWKVSNEIRAYVKKLIRWHLYPCQFGPESPRKSVLKYYRRMGEETLDVTLLALADRHSACGDWLSQEDFDKAHEAHLWLMANYEREAPTLNLPRLLTGNDLMRILNVGPGPHLKAMLEALQEAQQLGEVQDGAQAEVWVLARYGHS
ncbi:CCA tRNA nucleotidyltransferase [Vampirovibrio chlorellavorus]|uniref:CCA tRNA nucleotidyltransferase n=1 Tax=Vampirovibrio chlorellavorus TaxID=758823 RepID=UPI0026F11C6E|nr:HD domain-containing protein [Vampirovibrio chlorellavorus]